MTNIKLFHNDRGKVCRIYVQGHSGYGKEGGDIVCASISSAVWLTANGLETVLHIPIEITEGDGILNCMLPELEGDLREKADILLESLWLFLKELQNQYSEYLSLLEV